MKSRPVSLLFLFLLLIGGSLAIVAFWPERGTAEEVVLTAETEARIADLLAEARKASGHGETVEAIRLIKEAKRWNPRSVDAYLLAHDVYLAQGLVQGAYDELKSGITAAGEDARLLLAVSRILLEHQKRPDQALQVLQKVSDLDPAHPGLEDLLGSSWVEASEAYFIDGNVVAAKDAVVRGLRRRPGATKALRVRAKIAQGEKRWQDAVEDWEAVFSQAQDEEAQYSLAQCLKRLGYVRLARKQRREAMAHFARAVKLGGDKLELDTIQELLRTEAQKSMERGIGHFESGEYVEAEAEFRYSASLLPENPLALNHQGLCLLKLGRKADAALAWEEAILQAEKSGVDLSAVPTHKNLFLLYREMGKGSEADRVAASYRKNFPDGPMAGDFQR